MNWAAQPIILQERIEEVASFVSRIYATFPRLDEKEREQWRQDRVCLDELKEIPPTLDVETFESTLKQKIIEVLSQSDESACHIELSTDYVAEKTLREVAYSVFKLKQMIGLFPRKTLTRIQLEEGKTILRLILNFKAH